jgi:hypothetical protein
VSVESPPAPQPTTPPPAPTADAPASAQAELPVQPPSPALQPTTLPPAPAADTPAPALVELPAQPQPQPAAQMPQTAQSLLMMLRGTATRDAPAPAEAHGSLLEELRASSAANPPPREGLLGLLAQPAVWDLPLAATQPPGLAPLTGRPIQAPAPGGPALLDLPPGGFGTAPPPWPAPQPAVPAAAPWAPEPAAMAAPAPSAAPAAPMPADGSLAEMFRIVAGSPPPVAEPPKPTDSLKDILRGLRPDRRA